MISLYAHQKKIIDEDPKKCGLFLGVGTGKTRTALCLARGKTLVIAPLTQVQDENWQREMQKIGFDLDITVISKETFRRDHEKLLRYDTVICDESHTMCGLTPNTRQRKKMIIPKASQLFEALQEFLDRTAPDRLYLCTGTPIRSPMTVLAVAWLLGKKWDFYQFRSVFYVKLNMPGREVWGVKRDNESKDHLARIVRGLGYTGRIQDFQDVPDQVHVVKNIPLTTAQKEALKAIPLEYPDPIVLIGKKHQIEQGILSGNEFEEKQFFPTEKLQALQDICEQYDKVLIFAKYTAQIELIKKTLDCPVFVLNGQTKDKGQAIAQANKAGRCVVIAQSTISAGYELPDFRCTVYASMDYSIVSYEQSIGRTLRINNPQKNLYIYLLSGEIDKAVYDCIMNKKDFSERVYLHI